MIKTNKLNVKITFIEEVLGSLPGDPEVFMNFVSQNKDTLDEEMVAIIESNKDPLDKITVFPRTEEGIPFIYDYQIKGFFKEACSSMCKCRTKDPETGKYIKGDNESSKIFAFKKVIDGLVFPNPRKILFEGKNVTPHTELSLCQRPIRIEEKNGERVALACSEVVPAGTTCTFSILFMNSDHEAAIREWLDYGEFRGLLQWRNSGKGRFTWEEIK